MEPNTQSVRKCIHQKFLPIGEHPAQEGVLEPSCGHITPLYNFGWCLPMEEIDQYYPECEWDMANYWPKHVRVPWAKEFRNKYLSKEQPGFGYSPYLDFFFLKKKPYVTVMISQNSSKETLAMSRNEEYIADVKRLALVRENFGEPQWIRCT
ncbi:hypothetical protein F5876DRAFT_64925 [Lentinula aff. lateritia]|uniref:Uncharacterized protein n=1 Tax=Lentinula aff. lateritia TaxID=2804960 RepID=A0ACC1U2T0_9AGAR|nr:hypothetical protein F5876DRAFT_64925 [Lentinula aff. lateritia]